MENKNDKNGLKQQVVDQLSKHLDDEELLKLNEMEEVEGGVCLFGCVAACLASNLKAVSTEPEDGKEVQP